ncbi:MAG TPA: sugar phosphate isomerase/epimerase family protein, partial [Salegentibacter sp.]|nr:sugar phosphate isomerase/epimerase family protein [Salegentibacter sp.]
GIISCKDNQKNQDQEIDETAQAENNDPFFKLSLAQWSLNKQIFAGDTDPMEFARVANELGFEGVEYVSGLYAEGIKKADDPQKAMQEVLDTLKAKSEEYNVANVLIMVDGEGELASPDEATRNTAVENHKKWVDAAEFLGCQSIRVNLFGTNDQEEWKSAAVDGLTKLSEYASEKNINVLVENHGYLSSNAALLVEVMEEVNKENVGTLPDFGNFCLKRKEGEQWEAECVEEYPIYQGIEEMMPYAKAVSAKSYDFDEEGNETKLDYARILKTVKDAGYTGFIGVEYEGERLSEEEGIIATRDLLIKEGSKLNDNQ